ncbi:TetR family transcriptional regulator [Nocardioides sp.]|uniref:TetR/AcrR family transcriptional regulator n=1 Tax=Nocardioides sp. TaxID=35761 RepID=UPI002735AC74|nr:TetR family transcriptional regulator [Nocardioides sp.]MDP3891661.1 TetR family transcriptional regulator [Nocardioides sp.]
MSEAPRRGRRPGASGAQAAILAAARKSFATAGFSGTTIRGVASAAAVDPALVHHYFGTKADLFIAALELPVDPRALLLPAMEPGPEGAAERLLRVFLSVWDDPVARLPLLALVRGVMEPSGQQLVRDGWLPVVVGPVLGALGVDDLERRVPLVASQVIGLIIVRYVLAVEPLASMPPEEVVAVYAPTLQRYLTGPLP